MKDRYLSQYESSVSRRLKESSELPLSSRFKRQKRPQSSLCTLLVWNICWESQLDRGRPLSMSRPPLFFFIPTWRRSSALRRTQNGKCRTISRTRRFLTDSQSSVFSHVALTNPGIQHGLSHRRWAPSMFTCHHAEVTLRFRRHWESIRDAPLDSLLFKLGERVFFWKNRNTLSFVSKVVSSEELNDNSKNNSSISELISITRINFGKFPPSRFYYEIERRAVYSNWK